ncbi:fungal-specific transcription factor domain-containing protein [Jackrogersella minutella]|nr:fungal-specific transcription factor domain-containing protein [Jackrogersella minutella]
MTSALRQQPGLACENCRKKKSRCDRVRPECGSCTATGAVCIFTNKRPQRGPRKGQIQALRARVASLERCLNDQSDYVDLENSVFFGPLTPMEGGMDTSSMTDSPQTTRKASINQSSDEEHDHLGHIFSNLDNNVALNAAENSTSNRRFENLDQSIFSDLLLPIDDAATLAATTQPSDEDSPEGSDMTFISGSTAVNGSTQPLSQHSWNNPWTPEKASYNKTPNAVDEIGDLVQADLDQLYFDRVQPVTPLVHRARYFSWAGKPDKPKAHAALQSAMRTLASAASAAYQGLSNSLHIETCQMLTKLDNTTENDLTDNIPLEHIQAWLLLTHYEFMRKPHRRAMMTAGRAFRMVQVSLLHEIGEPEITIDDHRVDSNNCWAEAEEKRRTFWVAYCLDRCVGLYDACPLTFHENGMRTRLPAPENNFEASQPVRTDFLHDAIAGGQSTLSPFAECVVLLTLGERCMTQRPRGFAETIYGNDPLDLWARYEWLDNVLGKRRRRLALSLPSTSALNNPMLVFTHLVSATIVIHLMETLRNRTWSPTQHRVTGEAYEERATHAAREIVLLSKSVAQLSCFKAHPFVPGALFHGARILLGGGGRNTISADAAGAAEILGTLESLKGVNNLAQDSLRKLETSGVSKPRPNFEG